jgi:Putative phage serine protease XkdF
MDGSSLNVIVPFSKVDAEARLVSGFATLDNVDRVGDVMTADASARAFERFRGNVREMHQPIAAGRVVAFSQQDYYDMKSDTTYRGIYVTVYVSKGAQATWEKVLDGTLSAFSIGGYISEAEPVYDAENNRTIKVVKEYDLVELSLVDSPCNQLANVFSVTKSDDGELVFKGMAFETKTSNVFYCEDEGIAIVSSEESKDCASCNKTMENIGWIESADAGKNDVLKGIVSKHLSSANAEQSHEGGIEVSDIATSVEEVEPIEKADEVVEEAVTEVEAADEVVADAVEEVAEEVEKADEGSDVEAVDTPDFEKFMDDIKSVVTDAIAKSVEQADSVRASVDDFVKSVDAKFDELDSTYKILSETVGKIEKGLTEIEARLESINSSTAIKKSSELGGSEEVTKSNIWGGRFLGVSDL